MSSLTKDDLDQLQLELSALEKGLLRSHEMPVQYCLPAHIVRLYKTCDEHDRFSDKNRAHIERCLNRMHGSYIELKAYAEMKSDSVANGIASIKSSINRGSKKKVSKQVTKNMRTVLLEFSTSLLINDFLIKAGVRGHADLSGKLSQMLPDIIELIPMFDNSIWDIILPASMPSILGEDQTSCQNMRIDLAKVMDKCAYESSDPSIGSITKSDEPVQLKLIGDNYDGIDAPEIFDKFGEVWDGFVSASDKSWPFDISWDKMSDQIIPYFDGDLAFGEMLDNYDAVQFFEPSEDVLAIYRAMIMMYLANTSKEIIEDEGDPNDPRDNAIEQILNMIIDASDIVVGHNDIQSYLTGGMF